MAPNTRRGLARALSKLGYCSRSQATELVHDGRVRLNGSVCRDAERSVHPEKDRIEVDGRPDHSPGQDLSDDEQAAWPGDDDI